MTRALLAALAVALIALLPQPPAATAAGGLSITPAVLERVAQPGSVGSIRVTNGTGQPIDIVAAARPWMQARSGAVRPNVRRRLGQVRLSAPRFRLGAGQSRTIQASLIGRPAAHSVYGAVEVIGTPRGARPRNGIVARYRLLASLRLNPPPPRRRLRVQVGAVRLAGATLRVRLRNRGNTVLPITGSVRITGATGTLRTTITGRRILPGATVDVRQRTARLQRGRYAVTIRLSQGGRTVATVTRPVRAR